MIHRMSIPQSMKFDWFILLILVHTLSLLYREQLNYDGSVYSKTKPYEYKDITDIEKSSNFTIIGYEHWIRG